MAVFTWPPVSALVSFPNGQEPMVDSIPVVIASDQSPVPVSGPLTDTQLRATPVPISAASLPLPTGAATEAKQDTGNTSLGSIDTKTPALVSGRVPVDGSGVTQPVSGTVTADAGAGTFAVSAASLPLPTGAATEGKQDTGNASLASVDGKLGSLGQKTMAGSAPVVFASDQSALLINQAGRARANTPVFLDFSSTSVTTGAWVTFVASLSAACSAIEIYNNSASFIRLGTGAAASEVDQILIPPGGNGFVPLAIASSTRVALRAQDVSATTGKIAVNFYA